MKTVSLFLLIITTILVSTALAAPILDMYSLNETDCRVCHNDLNVLRNTDHFNSHDGTECSVCHAENAPKKLNCMNASGCHADLRIGVANHHELEDVESCLICHEQGVPRGK